MPKEVTIVEGGPLMDPSSQEFQSMLVEAQTAVAEKLATQPDASMVEDTKDVKEKTVSSTESPVDDKDKDTEDLEEDVDTLKHRISGLQAELSRIRKQRTGSTEEASSLKEQIANMQGQLTAMREGKTTQTVEDKLAKLTDDQVNENRILWDDELADARVVARIAERDRDTEAVKEANERIAVARRALKLYDTERDRRVENRASSKQTAADQRTAISTELDTLFEGVYKAVPEMGKVGTPIWKAGKAEYDALPNLMKQLGPLGELIAAAAAIAKNPTLIGKKATEDVLDKIEKAADKAFQKGGTAPNVSVRATTTINSQKDLLDFEEQVRRVKGG